MAMVKNPWADTLGDSLRQANDQHVANHPTEYLPLFEEPGSQTPPTSRERLLWAIEDAWRAVRLWLIRLLAGSDIDVR